jgi:hypothetical protein
VKLPQSQPLKLPLPKPPLPPLPKPPPLPPQQKPLPLPPLKPLPLPLPPLLHKLLASWKLVGLPRRALRLLRRKQFKPLPLVNQL